MQLPTKLPQAPYYLEPTRNREMTMHLKNCAQLLAVIKAALEVAAESTVLQVLIFQEPTQALVARLVAEILVG